MAQARAMANVTISWGLMQGSMKIYTATNSDQFRAHTRSFCSCGAQPKQHIVCESCNTDYGWSWDAVPQRGYEWTKGKFVKFAKAVWEAATKVETNKNLEIEKVVPLKSLVTEFVLAEPIFIMPDERAGGVAASKLYRLLIETLGGKDEAILTHLNLRGSSKRLAIVADTKGVLMGYTLENRKELPFVAQDVQVSAVEKAQMDMMLAAVRTNDVTFPAAEDGRLKLVEDAVLAETGAKPESVAVEVEA